MLSAMVDRRGTGVCGSDVPPLMRAVLTGTGLTLDKAAPRDGAREALPALTAMQRRIVADHATGRYVGVTPLSVAGLMIVCSRRLFRFRLAPGRA